MSKSLQLVSYVSATPDKFAKAIYKAIHSTGGHEGTSLVVLITIEYFPAGPQISMDFGAAKYSPGSIPSAMFAKLAEWCSRLDSVLSCAVWSNSELPLEFKFDEEIPEVKTLELTEEGRAMLKGLS